MYRPAGGAVGKKLTRCVIAVIFMAGSFTCMISRFGLVWVEPDNEGGGVS